MMLRWLRERLRLWRPGGRLPLPLSLAPGAPSPIPRPPRRPTKTCGVAAWRSTLRRPPASTCRSCSTTRRCATSVCRPTSPTVVRTRCWKSPSSARRCWSSSSASARASAPSSTSRRSWAWSSWLGRLRRRAAAAATRPSASSSRCCRGRTCMTWILQPPMQACSASVAATSATPLLGMPAVVIRHCLGLPLRCSMQAGAAAYCSASPRVLRPGSVGKPSSSSMNCGSWCTSRSTSSRLRRPRLWATLTSSRCPDGRAPWACRGALTPMPSSKVYCITPCQ
mmetsp:Transcript_114022/g.308011  ORF Transcript_114022/g.308011 Transcript_114022/m.308011 type:complete len:281 (-) Transcript_114022:19-861(-)